MLGWKKLTETTLNRDVEVLRHVLFWAVEERLLAANPLARSRLARARRIKRPILSVQEEIQLLSAAAPHLQQIIIAALDTGMRRGEILQQRWEDIDFFRRILVVTKSKTAEGEAREIPLSARLFELLKTKTQSKGLIFLYGERSIQAIKTAWRTAVRKSGIRPFRFKDLRSTFNSRLIEAGVIKDVRMELMGHSRNEDTNDLYSHIELPALRTAIQKLEQWREQQIESEQQPDAAAMKRSETNVPTPKANPAWLSGEAGKQAEAAPTASTARTNVN